MNPISMFSSSEDLRGALHSVLAASYVLCAAADASGDMSLVPQIPWWQALSCLEVSEQALAQCGQLPRQRLGELLCRADVHLVLARTWRFLGLPPPSLAELTDAFRDAELSSRALRLHGGRDVYGSSNKRLWDLLVAPLQAACESRCGEDLLGWAESSTMAERAADQAAIARLRELMAFDTRPEGRDHQACASYLQERLTELGFSVRLDRGDGPPLLAAHRGARGLQGAVVLYGHYDVAPLGSATFTHPPMELSTAPDEGGAPAAGLAPRLFGRGAADNKGPLAVRLAALAELPQTPELHILLQGEEETGSRRAHTVFPQWMAALRPTLWLDETGYHDHADGTLRLLARTIGKRPDASEPPDPALRELLLGLRLLATRHRIATREQWRSLNKSEVLGGCPFNRNLPPGARYLALGINDSRAQIHRADESIPTWTFPLHRAELRLVFGWVDRTARAAS